MQQLNKIVLRFLTLILIVGCQEVYEPKDLSSEKEILVINGLFTNIDSTVLVNIKHADVFGKETFIGVSDAIVWLKDNLGNTYAFSAGDEKGNYKLGLNVDEIDFDAEYYIQVKTSNGQIYESYSQLFPGNVTVNKIRAEIGEKEFSMKNDAGEVITFVNKGLHIDISLKSEDQNKKYVRFADTAIYQSQYSYFVPSLLVRCVSYQALSTIPITESTINVNGSEEINSKSIGFLRFINDTDYQNTNSTARVTDSWVLKSSVYSISKECLNYYNAIINQVSAQNKIFDPAPSQIFGNVHCITDPEQIVLGYFEMSRKITTYIAFAWAEGEDSYKQIDMKTYNAPSDSHCTENEPDFDWITFE